MESNSTSNINLGEWLVEEWRDVKGYEGYYRVSNLGRVIRLPRNKQGRYTHFNIRKQRLRNGYMCVNLSRCNKVQWFFVHRLVALAFIPNPNNYPQVNHIDECRTNNNVKNLEWVTQSQNNKHGTAIQRQIQHRHESDPHRKIWKAAAMKHAKKCSWRNKADNSIIKRYNSLTDAAENSGISITTILNQCKGKRKSRTSSYWTYE
jgi:hypothetical protein